MCLLSWQTVTLRSSFARDIQLSHYAPCTDLTATLIALQSHTKHTKMPSMDYNPRMSMARGSQQSSQQKRTKEDESDAFMTLVCSMRLARAT